MLCKGIIVRGIRPGPMSPEGLRKMMAKFEATGFLFIVSGRGRKPISVETGETVALAVAETAMKRTHGHAVACQTDVPWSMMYKIISKMLVLPIQTQTCSRN